MSKGVLVMMCPGFPRDELDTTCLPAVQQFVVALAGETGEDRLIVITFQYPFTRGEYRWRGIRVIALGGRNRPGMFRLATWLRAYAALRRVNRENGISGMLSFWLGECSLVGKWFARRRGLRHFTWIQGQDAGPGNRYVNRVKPAAGELVAISDFTRDEFLRNYGVAPAHVIRNAVDPVKFPPLNAERDVDILGAGSLTPLKSYDLFIEVTAELKASFPRIRAVIAGKGPGERRLREMISSLDLQDNVELRGEVSHDEVLRLMNRSRIFFHPSQFEGNSSAILEALYSGCQVLARQSPGGEIIGLHTAGDKTEMTEMLRRLLTVRRRPARVALNTFGESAKAFLSLFGK
jgi:glycosyltransferase involved in cell wall biosynthesis